MSCYNRWLVFFLRVEAVVKYSLIFFWPGWIKANSCVPNDIENNAINIVGSLFVQVYLVDCREHHVVVFLTPSFFFQVTNQPIQPKFL